MLVGFCGLITGEKEEKGGNVIFLPQLPGKTQTSVTEWLGANIGIIWTYEPVQLASAVNLAFLLPYTYFFCFISVISFFHILFFPTRM